MPVVTPVAGHVPVRHGGTRDGREAAGRAAVQPAPAQAGHLAGRTGNVPGAAPTGTQDTRAPAKPDRGK